MMYGACGNMDYKNFKNFTNWQIHFIRTLKLSYVFLHIEFLDVNIKIKDGFIQTEFFSKDTDKHMSLQVTSSHPNSVKTAIPYGLGIRAKRICSKDEDYSVRRREIKTHLLKRIYK